jgi:hypothetical protein
MGDYLFLISLWLILGAGYYLPAWTFILMPNKWDWFRFSLIMLLISFALLGIGAYVGALSFVLIMAPIIALKVLVIFLKLKGHKWIKYCLLIGFFWPLFILANYQHIKAFADQFKIDSPTIKVHDKSIDTETIEGWFTQSPQSEQ